MGKYRAGYVHYMGETSIDAYTDDFKTFVDEEGNPLDGEDLECWAVTANSPWSQAHERYTIKCNCKDAYTEMDKNDFVWKCKYSIIGYDMIEAAVYGYGNTEGEALSECIKHFKEIQEMFNKEDESF